jgi:hypothetical protein
LEEFHWVAEVEHAEVAAASFDGVVHGVTQHFLALSGQLTRDLGWHSEIVVLLCA